MVPSGGAAMVGQHLVDPLDAMQFLGRWIAQVRSGQPAQRSFRIDRDCPPDTARARSLWHEGGTAGEDDVAQSAEPMAPLSRRARPVLGHHCVVGKPLQTARQLCWSVWMRTLP